MSKSKDYPAFDFDQAFDFNAPSHEIPPTPEPILAAVAVTPEPVAEPAPAPAPVVEPAAEPLVDAGLGVTRKGQVLLEMFTPQDLETLRADEFFPRVDLDLATDYACPCCGYEWSGNPKPQTADAEAETDS